MPAPQKTPANFLKEVAILLGAGAGTLFIMFLLIARGGLFRSTSIEPNAAISSSPSPTSFEEKVNQKVISDTIAQFEIVKRSGNPSSICTHAGRVAAAYLHAKDETGYREWKDTQANLCSSVGLPF